MGCSGDSSLREEINTKFRDIEEQMRTNNNEEKNKLKNEQDVLNLKIKELKEKLKKAEEKNNQYLQEKIKLNLYLKETKEIFSNFKDEINNLKKEQEKFKMKENESNKQKKEQEKNIDNIQNSLKKINIKEKEQNNLIDKIKIESENFKSQINNLQNQLEEIKNNNMKEKEENKSNGNLNQEYNEEEIYNERNQSIDMNAFRSEEIINENKRLKEENEKLKKEKQERYEMINNFQSHNQFFPNQIYNNNFGRFNENMQINNFFISSQREIINIFFIIDNKRRISVPVYPNDKLKDAFITSLKKNNIFFFDIKEFRFKYNTKDITQNFINNDYISSLNLRNNSQIEVHT